jgi:hypothetical protein
MMASKLDWARTFGMMDPRGQQRGWPWGVQAVLANLPGDDSRREREVDSFQAWVVRDFCLKPELTLSEQLHRHSPARWSAHYQAAELANAESHLCTLISIGRVHRLKADLLKKEAIVSFGGGKRRPPLAELIQTHHCWDIVSGDYLKVLHPATTHAAVLARLRLLSRVVTGLKMRIARASKRELSEIARATGRTLQNDSWLVLLENTGFSLQHAFRLLCENNDAEVFVAYFRTAAKVRVAMLRAEYASDLLKLPNNVKGRMLACFRPPLHNPPQLPVASREAALRNFQSQQQAMLRR